MLPESVAVRGSELKASLQNTLRAKQLQLKLTAYDGFLRLYINEDPTERRFEVGVYTLTSARHTLSSVVTASWKLTLEMGSKPPQHWSTHASRYNEGNLAGSIHTPGDGEGSPAGLGQAKTEQGQHKPPARERRCAADSQAVCLGS